MSNTFNDDESFDNGDTDERMCTECMEGCTSCEHSGHCYECEAYGYVLDWAGKRLSFQYNLTLPRR